MSKASSVRRPFSRILDRGMDQICLLHQHFVVLDFAKHPLSVVSWGHIRSTDIATFELNELLATNMQTIYRRRSGRDMFGLAIGRAHGRSGEGQIVDALWGTLTARVVW